VAIVLPGASYQQFAGKSTTPLVHNKVSMHTQVGSQTGSLAHGAGAENPYAHLYTAGNGHTVQGQDLAFRAAANLQGNPTVIAWETSDLGEGIWPSPWRPVPWTPAQVEEIVSGLTWLCVRFVIPPVLVASSAHSLRGISYHRQGIPPWPEYIPGTPEWSTSFGKSCPTDPRKAQLIDEIIPRVRAIVLGDDMTEADFVRMESIIRQVVLDANTDGGVRRELRRLYQKLATGVSNPAFPPDVFPDAVTNPKLLEAIKHTEAAIPTIGDIDVPVLAAAIVAAMPPGSGVDQATVEAGVRAVIPDITGAVIAEIAS